jgi:group I intron endonuclease
MEYIYMILNKENGKTYLGRTKKPGNRRRGHFSELRRNVHNNPRLQAAFNKYGESAFIFEIIDSVEDGKSEEAEARWFARYNCDKKLLYNCHFETYGGPSCFGPMADVTKEKISEAIKENTRPKAYATLDEMLLEGVSLREASRRTGMGASTLISYKKERAIKEGFNIAHPQSKASQDRVKKFAEAFKADKSKALANFASFGISRKALAKYLPDFGIDPKEIRFDHWRTKAAACADAAVQMVFDTGCSAAQAIKACGAKNSAYYRRLKEVKHERGLLLDPPTTV